MNRYCELCARETQQTQLYEKNGFHIVRCETCSLVSTAIPHGFDPIKIYDQAYFDSGHQDGYADYAGSEEILRREFGKVVSELKKHKSIGSLVEIGSAYGFFLKEAKNSFEVAGVEVSQAARVAAAASGLRVYERLEQAREHGPFDAAVLLDCIEHLEHPRKILAELRQTMRDDGVLLITTGDFGSVLAKTMGKNWRLMTPPQHLFFFDQKTIREMLLRSGFKLISFDHPTKTVPLELAHRQLKNLYGLGLPLPGFLAKKSVLVNLFDSMRVVARCA